MVWWVEWYKGVMVGPNPNHFCVTEYPTLSHCISITSKCIYFLKQHHVSTSSWTAYKVFLERQILQLSFCLTCWIPVPDWLYVSSSCWGSAVSSCSLNLSSSLNTGKPFAGTEYSCLHSGHVNPGSSVFSRLSAIILSVNRLWDRICVLNLQISR